GKPFIAMQFVDGASVADIAKGHGRLPPTLAAAIVLGMARGLVAIHAAGIVHRDVKPANTLITRDGRIRIADMGLAKFVRGVGGAPPPPEITKPGSAIGTPLYIAPEQAHGDQVDGRADIFALGVTFYELLTGNWPFRGRDALETVALRFTEEPRRPRDILPDIPPAIEQACLAFLEKDPARRPNANQAVIVLERLAAGDRSRELVDLFCAPQSATTVDLGATMSKTYGLDGHKEDDGIIAATLPPPTASSPIRSPFEAPAAPAAPPPRDSRVLVAALYAFGSCVLTAGAITVALILRSPPPAPAPAPPPPPVPAPAPATPTRENAAALLKAAIASRHALKVRTVGDEVRAASGIPDGAALAQAAMDAERLLGVFEVQTRTLDPALPLERVLDELKKAPRPDDDLRAAATLLAAVEGQAVPAELLLPADAKGSAAERLERALKALGLDRPSQK
ncbi:MAG TPA: serine/threonine-protein kinase, partial [Planctomycetota bacterium]|nr:serine/threonine-protein kinase [Planctomycetota bacterium]